MAGGEPDRDISQFYVYLRGGFVYTDGVCRVDINEMRRWEQASEGFLLRDASLTRNRDFIGSEHDLAKQNWCSPDAERPEAFSEKSFLRV